MAGGRRFTVADRREASVRRSCSNNELARDDESSEVVVLSLRQGISRMNWAWATSLDHIWRSPSFPMWLTMAAAAFFGMVVVIALLRAEKSVANGALTVITLLAIG